MIISLETRNVFIDTQVVIEANYQFKAGSLKRLADLAKKGSIHLVLTTVTVQEVISNLNAQISESKRAMSQFRKDGRVLWNCTSPCFSVLFKKTDWEQIRANLTSQFEGFLADTKATILPINDSVATEVFERYFSSKAPFEEAEKKKHEFPDAFALSSLEKWCEGIDEKAYVVTGDKGFQRACDGSWHLIAINKAERMLEMVAKEDELSELADLVLEPNIDLLKEGIVAQFEWAGFYVETHEGNVEDVKVISVELLDSYLVEVAESAMTFGLDARIRYSAEVTYADPNYGFYDEERRQFVSMGGKQATVEREEEISAEVQIAFDKECPESSELVGVNLDISDVGIDV